jgi:hypothetical protein
MLTRLSHDIKNGWMALKAYPDMSPNLNIRRKINRILLSRPAHSVHEWYQRLWRPLGVRSDVATFVYQILTECSGLMVGRLLPSDRMVADLQLPLVCWFDWEMTCMELFWQNFDPSGSILESLDETELDTDPTTFETLQDWVLFLNQAAIRSSEALES